MVWDSAVRGNFFYKQNIQLFFFLEYFNYFQPILIKQIDILNFRPLLMSSWGLDAVMSNLNGGDKYADLS